MVTLAIVGLILLALFGEPLFILIAGATFLLLYGDGSENFFEVIIKMIDLNSKPELTAIPLFTFAGYMMAESGTPRRLVNLANAVLGWLPGGLAIVSLVVCALFTAFTGASGVTVIAIGSLLLPVLIKEHYPHNYSLGLIAATSNVGLLFPPSLPIIVYGIVSGAPIDHLFIAGVLPGFVILLLLIIYSMSIGAKNDIPRHKFKLQEVGKTLRGALWELPLPVVILGGIYGGFFAPLQAAAVTAAYVFIIEVLIYRDIHPTKHLPKIMQESMVMIGGILVILAAAGGFTDYLITEQIPEKLFDTLSPFISNQVIFFIVINIFLLIVGCMMDIFSAIFVVVPLIIPFANKYGVDPVHLGIIFLANLGIGYATPPVGMNLFIASFAFKEPMVKLYRAALPFLGILLVALLIITYVPQLSLYPLDLFGVERVKTSIENEELNEELDLDIAPKDKAGAPSDEEDDEGLDEFIEDKAKDNDKDTGEAPSGGTGVGKKVEKDEEVHDKGPASPSAGPQEESPEEKK